VANDLSAYLERKQSEDPAVQEVKNIITAEQGNLKQDYTNAQNTVGTAANAGAASATGPGAAVALTMAGEVNEGVSQANVNIAAGTQTVADGKGTISMFNKSNSDPNTLVMTLHADTTQATPAKLGTVNRDVAAPKTTAQKVESALVETKFLSGPPVDFGGYDKNPPARSVAAPAVAPPAGSVPVQNQVTAAPSDGSVLAQGGQAAWPSARDRAPSTGTASVPSAPPRTLPTSAAPAPQSSTQSMTNTRYAVQTPKSASAIVQAPSPSQAQNPPPVAPVAQTQAPTQVTPVAPSQAAPPVAPVTPATATPSAPTQVTPVAQTQATPPVAPVTQTQATATPSAPTQVTPPVAPVTPATAPVTPSAPSQATPPVAPVAEPVATPQAMPSAPVAEPVAPVAEQVIIENVTRSGGVPQHNYVAPDLQSGGSRGSSSRDGSARGGYAQKQSGTLPSVDGGGASRSRDDGPPKID